MELKSFSLDFEPVKKLQLKSFSLDYIFEGPELLDSVSISEIEKRALSSEKAESFSLTPFLRLKPLKEKAESLRISEALFSKSEKGIQDFLSLSKAEKKDLLTLKLDSLALSELDRKKIFKNVLSQISISETFKRGKAFFETLSLFETFEVSLPLSPFLTSLLITHAQPLLSFSNSFLIADTISLPHPLPILTSLLINHAQPLLSFSDSFLIADTISLPYPSSYLISLLMEPTPKFDYDSLRMQDSFSLSAPLVNLFLYDSLTFLDLRSTKGRNLFESLGIHPSVSKSSISSLVEALTLLEELKRRESLEKFNLMLLKDKLSLTIPNPKVGLYDLQSFADLCAKLFDTKKFEIQNFLDFTQKRLESSKFSLEEIVSYLRKDFAFTLLDTQSLGIHISLKAPKWNFYEAFSDITEKKFLGSSLGKSEVLSLSESTFKNVFLNLSEACFLLTKFEKNIKLILKTLEALIGKISLSSPNVKIALQEQEDILSRFKKILPKSWEETFQIFSAFEKSFRKAWSEVLQVTEVLSKLFEKGMGPPGEPPGLKDSLLLTDSLLLGKGRGLYDSLSFIDSKLYSISKSLFNTLVLSLVGFASLLNKKADIVSLSDILSKDFLKRIVSEIQIFDFIKKDSSKALLDSISGIDFKAAKLDLHRFLIQSIADSLEKSFGKFTFDSETFSDLISKKSIKELKESISFLLAFEKDFNFQLFSQLTLQDVRRVEFLKSLQLSISFAETFRKILWIKECLEFILKVWRKDLSFEVEVEKILKIYEKLLELTTDANWKI